LLDAGPACAGLNLLEPLDLQAMGYTVRARAYDYQALIWRSPDRDLLLRAIRIFHLPNRSAGCSRRITRAARWSWLREKNDPISVPGTRIHSKGGTNHLADEFAEVVEHTHQQPARKGAQEAGGRRLWTGSALARPRSRRR